MVRALNWSVGFAAATAAMAAAGLLGSFSGHYRWLDLAGTGIPMQGWAAISLLLISAAIGFAVARRERPARVIILGLLSWLLLFAISLNFGLKWTENHFWPDVLLSTGQFSLTVALALAVAAAGVLALIAGQDMLASAVGTALVMLASLICAAFLYSALPLLTMRPWTPASLQTGLGLGFIGLALLAATYPRNWTHLFAGKALGAVMARRQLPWLLSIPLTIGFALQLTATGDAMGPEAALALLSITTCWALVAVLAHGAGQLNRTARERASLAAAVDLMPVVILDLDGRITHWSDGAVTLYGYTDTAAVGQRASDLLDTQLAVSWDIMVDVLLATGNWQGTARQRDRDGAVIPILLSASIIRNETGEVTGVVEAHHDARPLEQARQALENSQLFLARVVNNIPDIVFIAASNGEVDYLSPRFWSYTGLPRGPNLLAAVQEAVHPDDAEAVRSAWREGKRTGTAVRYECRMRDGDGNYCWFHIHAELFADEPGHPPQWFGVASNIHALRTAADAVKAANDMSSLALEAGGVGAFRWDVRADTLTATPEFRALYGVAQSQPLATLADWERCLTSEQTKRVTALIESLVRVRSERLVAEFPLVRPDKQTRWLEVRARIDYDAKGRPLTISGVNVDITRLKNAEATQRQLMAEVDHRARNVMAVVQGIVGLTARTDAAGFAERVIGRIGALSRAHSYLAHNNWSGVELAELIAGEMRFAHADSRKLQCDGPQVQLPARCAQPLALAFHELALNAARHGALTRPGGTVQVSWQITNGQLALEWREAPAEPGAEKQAAGLGATLIDQMVRQVDGRLSRSWQEGAFIVSLTLPLDAE